MKIECEFDELEKKMLKNDIRSNMGVSDTIADTLAILQEIKDKIFILCNVAALLFFCPFGIPFRSMVRIRTFSRALKR